MLISPHARSRSCRVTIKDLQGVEHTVTVTASTLYEAVALALASLHDEEWVAEIAEGLNAAHVTVINVPVEHSVKLRDFNQWVERHGRSPREVTHRDRIRKILGLPSH